MNWKPTVARARPRRPTCVSTSLSGPGCLTAGPPFFGGGDQPLLSAILRQGLDPVLQTPRLVLRPPTINDFDHSLSLWSDPAVSRFIGGRPATGEDVWARVLRYIGHWQAMKFGYWAIFERNSGRFVGEAGFADFHRTIDPPLTGMPEMGWALSPWAHGSGFATEAVQAALAWGDKAFTAPACCTSKAMPRRLRISLRRAPSVVPTS